MHQKYTSTIRSGSGRILKSRPNHSPGALELEFKFHPLEAIESLSGACLGKSLSYITFDKKNYGETQPIISDFMK